MRVEVNPDLYTKAEFFSLALLDGGEVWHIFDYVLDRDYWALIAQDPEG